MHSNPDDHLCDVSKVSDLAARVIKEIEYDITAENENIEALLSRCEAYLQVKTSADVTTFISESKKVILSENHVPISDDNLHRNMRISRKLKQTGSLNGIAMCGLGF